MKLFTHSKHKKLWITLIAVGLVPAVFAGGCALYLADYYPADEAAIATFAEEFDIDYTTVDDNLTVFAPEGATKGLIFYPGGKVEHTAYLPLLQACAQKGILCVLVEMPGNLAVLDSNAADGIPELYPQIREWYIGGHSLGGSMAASYLANHTNEFSGLLLLGAYSTADLSDSKCSVLSVYGSEDLVMNREKYAENLRNLPADFTEQILQGGCHAYFGMYGAQDGDGIPTLSNREQIRQTVAAIVSWLGEDPQ